MAIADLLEQIRATGAIVFIASLTGTLTILTEKGLPIALERAVQDRATELYDAVAAEPVPAIHLPESESERIH